jgi:hypothetical protein
LSKEIDASSGLTNKSAISRALALISMSFMGNTLRGVVVGFSYEMPV